jgi:acetyl-CoA carboxylase biotin carboxyl carrier protein
LLTFEQIKELIELIAQRHLQGLEIERSGFRLKIDGQPAPALATAPAETAAFASPLPATAPLPAALPSSPASAPAGAAPAGAATPEAGSHILTSPIVGTFYRSPSPDAPPFADIGARVKKGQVLCIIEAMKLMNEIESDADGVVTQIFPQNAQAVEFGEPLFAIRPD